MRSQAGAVAQQQALVLVFGLSYRQAAKVANIHHRNLWSHVAAKPGSNVAPWESRPIEVKRAAIERAFGMLFESLDCVYNNIPEKAREIFRAQLLEKHDSNIVNAYLDFLHEAAPSFISIDEKISIDQESNEVYAYPDEV